MPRFSRNTLILGKLESVIGTDATPGASDALLVSDFNITPIDAKNIDRNLARGYMGASEQLVGVASVKLSFTCELAGSGTAGTAPAIGKLLQACGMAEAVLATPARVEYTPISTGFKTATLYYYDDGMLHKLLGAMGSFKLDMKVGDRPKIQFEFTGLRGGESVATATGSYTAWKTPVPMTKANVTDITMGAAYAVGALTGGTIYASTGLSLDLGNSVQFTPMLSAEFVDITDRDVSGSTELDLTAAQEVALMSSITSNTTQPLGFGVGTVAGNKLLIFAPAVQMISPKKSEQNGRRTFSCDLRLVPTPNGAGNDELRLIFL